jgi:c-di-GMP-binding flagellar brake protein YcgR
METPGQPQPTSPRIVPVNGPGGKRRRHQRVELDLPAALTVFDAEGNQIAQLEGRTRDISQSGCRVVITRMLHPGSGVVAVLAAGRGKRTVRYGTIRNCTYLEQGQHSLGIEFEAIPAAAYAAQALMQRLTAEAA